MNNKIINTIEMKGYHNSHLSQQYVRFSCLVFQKIIPKNLNSVENDNYKE